MRNEAAGGGVVPEGFDRHGEAHCDHEWVTVGNNPTHCRKCRALSSGTPEMGRVPNVDDRNVHHFPIKIPGIRIDGEAFVEPHQLIPYSDLMLLIQQLLKGGDAEVTPYSPRSRPMTEHIRKGWLDDLGINGYIDFRVDRVMPEAIAARGMRPVLVIDNTPEAREAISTAIELDIAHHYDPGLTRAELIHNAIKRVFST